MSTVIAPKPNVQTEDPDDDRDLQNELRTLVERIVQDDYKTIAPSLEMLKYLIRTSTSSMTSVPKPLKYLAPHYAELRSKCESMKDGPIKKNFCDIISVLSMGHFENKVEFDCLKFCLEGTMENIGDWGHEYIRQLEAEIVKQWVSCDNNFTTLNPLVKEIMEFNCTHHGEIQACDLLMEINQMYMLFDYVAKDNYGPICLYLSSCAKYVDDAENKKILKLVSKFYLKFGEFCRALIIAIQIKDSKTIDKLFTTCNDKLTLYQMAFICTRQLYRLELTVDIDDEDLKCILENSHLNQYFLTFARELDILEPKTPEEVYKTWLEPSNFRQNILGEKLDSARQNLASSFVNGFVNAGFGSDKLLTVDDGNKWIYRNKDTGMLSATAALGLLYLWDVDGGLTPIDKYLYTTEDNIKAGALLALGIVNCRIRNDCDPALALLGDYVESGSEHLQLGAVFGIGLAYAGTGREDVLSLLLPVINQSKTPKTLGIASLACGLVALGMNYGEITSAIMTKMIEYNNSEAFKSPHMLLSALGVALAYYGTKEEIELPTTIAEVFEEPFKTVTQTLLQMCAYAGSGDVLIIQELLRIVEEKVEVPPQQPTPAEKEGNASKGHEKNQWDYYLGKAVAVMAVAAICKGEEIGAEMMQRMFGHVARYGEPSVRRAVPLAIALTSVSDPQPTVINVLTKYSHDADDEVACNAIFALGYVGAGTNNARLAVGLRQMALFHAKNPSQLFMVRIAQGLIHLGKGTMTLNPLHTDRQLLDPVAMAGILVPLVALLKPNSLILSRSHYLLYSLAAAMQPRWLLTLDENLNSVSVTVRVGQAVDTVGKAGAPKTIAGIHTHTTPVLLNAGERAELANDDHQSVAPSLDGICVLRKK